MKVIKSVAEMAEAREQAPRPMALVPTMGALHEGHLSLVRRARSEGATVVASVFVNPTQFGPNEDLAAYPRDLERDLALLEQEGVDLVFQPSQEDIYPSGFATTVDVGALGRRLEGEFRPGHFRGVATVVCKLFTIIRPDEAYFGQKDAQQTLVIRRLNADLNLGVNVVVCPSVREADGLAMSSRNAYLGPEERRASTALFRALSAAQARFNGGERDADKLRGAMVQVLRMEPLAQREYVSVSDAETLEELARVDGPALALLAVRIGNTRLIDNVALG
ncbi:MAG: pantoate--beta-alanine ligase [Chloroflexi bacterium]|nr:MAG: pantoate--beta-alanine ligase [Chloroflexota bacterium]